ncbi:MAG: DUF4112 domain-containing protein [Polyangiales bacterium]
MDDELAQDAKRPAKGWPETIVRILDDGLRIPGTTFRFGFDAILGLLLPVAGDSITGMGSVTLLTLAIRRGVPTVVLLRMVMNIVVDVLLGAIPFVGDAFDLVWRSNRMNLELIERHAKDERQTSITDYASGA